MKLILYMAQTLNGYIAKENNETPWSEEEWKSFSNYVNKIDNLIIGRRTYEIMRKSKEFEKIGDPVIVVLSKKQGLKTKNIFFVKSAKKAISLLEEKGFKESLVAGGSKTNTSFIKENLIDEIILDIEPFIFGKGINLFSEENFEIKLTLVDTQKISDNLIQLHYTVIK